MARVVSGDSIVHRALRIVGFPPWLVQVGAKFGNQIAAQFPSSSFPSCKGEKVAGGRRSDETSS